MYVRLKSMKNRMNTLVSIVDYGVGNLSNIQRAFNIIGVNSIITSKPKEIMNSSHLLLPGVGAFEEGMTNLKNQNLVETVLEFSHSGRPVLGICLGMQLLLSCSYEGGKYSGLNLIEGEVIPLKKTLDIKIPNIGNLSFKDKIQGKLTIENKEIDNFVFPNQVFACFPPVWGVPTCFKLIYFDNPGSAQTTSAASHFPNTRVPKPAIGVISSSSG